jgi:hypothetical protein
MPFINVESSLIHSVEYFEDEEVLEIRFHYNTNYVYAYFDFPLETYRDFLANDSQGKFYNDFIKGMYGSSKKPI